MERIKYKKLKKYNEVVKAKKEEKKKVESNWRDTVFKNQEISLLNEKYFLMRDMTRWVKHYNKIDNFTPDWGDYSQLKNGLIIRKGELTTFWDKKENCFIFGLSVWSPKRAEQMLKEFGSRIEKYY